MANERAWMYRNTGTTEKPVWEKWFQKTVADAVFVDETGNENIIVYIQKKIDALIGGAPGTFDTLKEIADYIATHEEVATALNQAITNKAEKGHKHAATDITQDTTHRFVTDTEKSEWNNKAANTAFTGATASAAGKTGLVPAPVAGSQAKYLRADGTWQTPPDTNTTYSAATTSTAGLMSAADKKKLDGIATGANAYTLPTASSTTLGGVKTTSTVSSNSGHTPCPIIGGVPYYKDTNTTYSAATTSTAGLMSAADKKKLDGISSSANAEIYFASSLPTSAAAGAICFLIE